MATTNPALDAGSRPNLGQTQRAAGIPDGSPFIVMNASRLNKLTPTSPGTHPHTPPVTVTTPVTVSSGIILPPFQSDTCAVFPASGHD